MSGCFEYPQCHHQTHEKIFKTISKKVWKEEMTAIYLFKKSDFCKGIPLGKSNFLKW
eukprot:UN27642